MIVSRRYLIAGRVQGVGFRAYTVHQAAIEGVHGYVRNTDDGRVEVVVEGDEESVIRVERKLRHGPPMARVESVDVEPIVPTGRPYGFSIR